MHAISPLSSSQWLTPYQLFRGEFIFPPEGLATNLEKTLQGLEKDDVITITRDSAGAPQFVELSEAERRCGRENYDFYCFLTWPFIEASWLGAVSLLGLTPPRNAPQDVWLDYKKAQDNAQLVSFFLFAILAEWSANRPPSWAKPSTIKATSHTSKP